MNGPKCADGCCNHLWKNRSFRDVWCIQAWCRDDCHWCNKRICWCLVVIKYSRVNCLQYYNQKKSGNNWKQQREHRSSTARVSGWHRNRSQSLGKAFPDELRLFRLHRVDPPHIHVHAKTPLSLTGDELTRCVDLYNQSQSKWFEEIVTTSLVRKDPSGFC